MVTEGILLLRLHCIADDDNATVGAGHGALDQQEATLEVGLHHFEVQRGDLLVTHVTSHLQTLEDATGERARTDGSRCTVVLVVTVAGSLAGEVVTLHAACESLASADRRDIDTLTWGECVDLDLLADFEAVDRIEPQLDNATTR